MRRSRGAVALLLVSPLLLLVAPPAAPAPGAPGRCADSVVDGPWTVLPRPAFVPGPLLHVEVGGPDDQILVVADDQVVARSDDGGCTWREAYRVPVPADTSAAGNSRPQVKDVALAVDAEQDVLLVSTTAGPHVTLLRSEGGGPFEASLPGAYIAATTGFAPCNANEGCQIVVSEADPSRVFLHAGGSLEGGGQLWRSDDRGASFQLVHTAVTDPFFVEDIQGLHLDGVQQLRTDPFDKDTLVALYNCDYLARSTDGGLTWSIASRPGDPTEPFMGLAARRASASGPERLVAMEMNTYCVGSSMKMLYRSLDGGRTWTSTPYGGPDLHALELDSAGEIALVVDELGVVTRFDLQSLTTDRLSTPDGVPVTSPQVMSTPGSFALAAPDAVLLVELDVDPGADDTGVEDLRPELPRLRPCPEPPLRPAPSEPSSLLVEDSISARVGDRVVVPLRGEVGAGPVPVDVAFLLDDSGSMSDTQQSLARSVGSAAGRLRDSGVDLHMGLARFADLVTLPYQRMLPISPVDCHLDQRLAQFVNEGSTEPHLLALEQLVTGSGFRFVGLPPGGQLEFRDGALKLVVHATDEGVTEARSPYPSYEEVGDVYRRSGVTHVGLHVDGTNLAGTEDDLPVDPDAVRADLARISTATGSLATGPIDCNGDGLTDLAVGDPIVCGFEADLTVADGVLATEVGSIVAQVVDGLVGPVEVSVGVERAPDGTTVLVEGSSTLDPREGGAFPGRLSLSCDTAGAGTLRLGLRASGRLLATRDVAVACEGPGARAAQRPDAAPGAGLPAPGGSAPAPGVALAPPAPPPPVVPIPAPAPAAAGSGAAAGAAGGANSAAAGGSPGMVGSSGTTGALGAAPQQEGAGRRAHVTLGPGTAASEPPLAAVPLAGGALTTAVLTAHLLVTRRRRSGPPQRAHT